MSSYRKEQKMLSTKKVLYKIISVIRGANVLSNATLASGVTGFVTYAKCGRMVTLTGVLSFSSAKTSGATLATGLPIPYNSWSIGNIDPFTSDVKLRIGDNGALIANGAIASGTSNIRFAYSYVSNS